jgi:hypothetical protein
MDAIPQHNESPQQAKKPTDEDDDAVLVVGPANCPQSRYDDDESSLSSSFCEDGDVEWAAAARAETEAAGDEQVSLLLICA